MTFNFDSFFNKQILDGSEKISELVSRLSDEDFQVVCKACKIHNKHPITVYFDTEIKPVYGSILISDFKNMAETINNTIIEAANLYSHRPDASMYICQRSGKYNIVVYFVETLSRKELEREVVESLGKRKGKIIAKRLKPKSEKRKPEPPKTMVVDGVEYILTPKV